MVDEKVQQTRKGCNCSQQQPFAETLVYNFIANLNMKVKMTMFAPQENKQYKNGIVPTLFLMLTLLFISCLESINSRNIDDVDNSCSPLTKKVKTDIRTGLEAWGLHGNPKELILLSIFKEDTFSYDSVLFDTHGEMTYWYNSDIAKELIQVSTYNMKGNLTRQIDYDVSRGDTTSIDTSLYTYDEYGNIVSANTSNIDRTYEYCQKNAYITRVSYKSDSIVYDSSNFDLSGNILSRFYYPHDSECPTWKKYENNNVIESYVADSTCQYSKAYEWKYDEFGNQLKQYKDGEIYMEFSILEYDSKGNWLKRNLNGMIQIERISYY